MEHVPGAGKADLPVEGENRLHLVLRQSPVGDPPLALVRQPRKIDPCRMGVGFLHLPANGEQIVHRRRSKPFLIFSEIFDRNCFMSVLSPVKKSA